MTEIKNFDGDISVGRHAVVGGDAKVCGGVTVGKNLKVEGWLDAKNLKAANKGVFLNEESLKKAYPVPKDGWWALVGDTLPAALWVAADGEWGNTGGTGGDILLESEVLADIKERLARAQAGVEAASSKNIEQDSRLANAEAQNTKQNERLLNYVYPKLYQLNEGAGALPFDGEYSGSASVLSGRKTAAEEGYTYKVVFALGKFLLQEISPGGVIIGLYEEWDKIISGRGSSEDYAKRDRLYYVYTEGEGSYYYYVDADGNISEKSGTYLLRKLIDETNAEVSTNTEKLDVQERYVAALNAASSEHSQKIEAIEGRAGEIEAKNAEQDKRLANLLSRMNTQEEVVVALPFDGFTDAAADSLMLFNPKDTYSYRVLFSTASNSFVLSVTENVNQTGKYIGTYSSWNAVDGVQASSYYERRDTLYKYLDLSYGAYRYYYYGEDGSFFEAPGTKYLSRIIEKQGGKIDENTQKVEELQAQVSSIEKVEDIQWGGGRHMNVFIEKGDFHIHGERTDANDGLPILNAASGHTIDARLTVLDSSLTGGTGAKTDACVTQILRLSNRTGGDGHVYVRTAQAASKAELTATDNTRWGTWEKLMGMFEKNAVENATDLDTYTTNGMYSGVFMFSGYQQNWGVAITPGSTFLLVTVNGYAVAKAGLTPQLTQMLYLLPAKDFNAHAKMYLRTAYWNVSAKSWNYQNWDKIATSNDLSPITEEAQSAKTLANNNAGRISDVEVRVSGAEGRIAANTTKISSVESTANAAKSAAETAQTAANAAQETANSARETATAASTAAQEAKSAAETAQATANDANTKITELAGKVNGKQDALTLTVKDNGNIVLANIQGQSKEFMPATPSGDPMHYAFVTAGAEYNDTGADIVKDAPWADLADDDADKTVIHKAGYWYLNGLGDITNEQMQRIYMLTGSNQNYWNKYCSGQDVRTNIMTIKENSDAVTNLAAAADSGFRRCTIEVLRVPTCVDFVGFSIPYFSLIYVEKLKFIIGVFKASKQIYGSYIGNLKGIKIFGLYTSANFQDAKKLSMKSVLYMINNEAATSPITITLHADVYNRCMANEDILAALEAHTNISIASA